MAVGVFGVFASGVTFFFPFSTDSDSKIEEKGEKLLIKNTDSVVQGLNKTDSSFVNTLDMTAPNVHLKPNDVTVDPDQLNKEIAEVDPPVPGFRHTTTE